MYWKSSSLLSTPVSFSLSFITKSSFLPVLKDVDNLFPSNFKYYNNECDAECMLTNDDLPVESTCIHDTFAMKNSVKLYQDRHDMDENMLCSKVEYYLTKPPNSYWSHHYLSMLSPHQTHYYFSSLFFDTLSHNSATH